MHLDLNDIYNWVLVFAQTLHYAFHALGAYFDSLFIDDFG